MPHRGPERLIHALAFYCGQLGGGRLLRSSIVMYVRGNTGCQVRMTSVQLLVAISFWDSFCRSSRRGTDRQRTDSPHTNCLQLFAKSVGRFVIAGRTGRACVSPVYSGQQRKRFYLKPKARGARRPSIATTIIATPRAHCGRHSFSAKYSPPPSPYRLPTTSIYPTRDEPHSRIDCPLLL
ncbi:hypothetical protein KC349_g36 [Hortaea werneckii]|nr:hypothetical protein KC349_g36 [Hortaea werneckii]